MHFGFLADRFYRQSQPSAQPQAWHYRRKTMLHIKQSPTEIKESAHNQKPPRNNHPLRGTLRGQVQRLRDKVKNITSTVRGLIVDSDCAQGNF